MNLATTRRRREASRFAKFAVVGVVGALVDFGVFNLLLRRTGLGIVLSSVVSFTAASQQQLRVEPLLDLPGLAQQAARPPGDAVLLGIGGRIGHPHPAGRRPRASRMTRVAPNG